MADKRDYYEVLGLNKGASDDDIKKAYRNVAKKYIGNAVCAIDLAGAEAIYKTSDYAEEFKIAKENNSSYKDIGSNWVAVGNMNLKVNNRINEIGKIWAREQLIRAVNKARNYKISSKEKTDAK